MNPKIICTTFIGAGICLVSGFAHAAEESKGPKVSSEMRAAWQSTDNGLYKVAGTKTPDRTANFELERLKLEFRGNLDASADYRLRLDFNAADKVDFAYGTWWINKAVGVRVGQNKVIQGGIYNMTNGLFNVTAPVYAENKPHATYKPMFDLELNVAGKISVQLFDDQAAGKAQWHKVDQQPATAVSYVGDFNGVAPTVQFGSYDNNHSYYVSAGSGVKVAGVTGFVNAIWDRRSHKDSITAKDPKDKYDVLTSYELDGSYAVNKEIEPFVHLSTFNRVQDGTDSKINSFKVDATTTARTLNWDDNGTVAGIGTFYHGSEHVSPYLAVDLRSGKFAKDLSVASTTAESRQEVSTRLGLAAEF